MTIHRALGHVDRDATTEAGRIRVVMASEGKQADGIDLRMSGAQLERFRGNPVLGYGHSYWGRTNLPIGRVAPDSITVAGNRLLGELEFDTGDPFAVEVERKMRDGYLSAVSIGFNVTRWEDPSSNYWAGGVAETWELSELSVVPIPMDAAALVAGGRTADAPPGLLRALAEEFGLDAVVAAARRLDRTAEPAPQLEQPETPAPAASGIDEASARGLLAAFDTLKERHA